MNPQSTMEEILARYPWARRALFRRYHIGGCQACAFDPAETLDALCLRNNGLDPAEVLEHIRRSHDEDLRLQISPAETDRRLRAGERIRLLDIRTRKEWEAVRLPRAVRMDQEAMQEILGTWSREDLLVVYDHQGEKSLDAATYFQGQGFSNVRCLAGGIDAWSREIDPSLRRYRLGRS